MNKNESFDSKRNCAILFDLDGVLIDAAACFKLLDSTFLKAIVPEWTEENQREIWGMSLYQVHAFISKKFARALPESTFFSHYEKLAGRIYGSEGRVSPDLQGVLSDLRNQYALGIVSSSPSAWIRAFVRGRKLDSYFDITCGGDEVGGAIKPLPDLYVLAARKLGAPAGHCLAIEDSAKGIQSAKAAGMRCAGFGLEPSAAAELEVETFSDLTELTPAAAARLSGALPG